MHKLILLSAIALFVGCSSTDYVEPKPTNIDKHNAVLLAYGVKKSSGLYFYPPAAVGTIIRSDNNGIYGVTARHTFYVDKNKPQVALIYNRTLGLTRWSKFDVVAEDPKYDIAIFKLRTPGPWTRELPEILGKPNPDINLDYYTVRVINKGYPNFVKYDRWDLIKDENGDETNHINPFAMYYPLDFEPGDSGAPVFDSYGRLYGIVRATRHGHDNCAIFASGQRIIDLMEKVK